MTLPAFLQNNYQKRDLAEKATAGLGGGILPPHISIGGNRFAYVDAQGNRAQVQTTYLDVVIFDISDVTTKMYYANDWQPGSEDPPLCFSMNGVAPSVDAMEPQSETCEVCQWNKRGSKVSKISGAQIKACRDQKELAITVPGMQATFRLTLTPGSFRNWREYADKFKGQDVGFDVIVTRIAFEENLNGVLTFTPIGYVDEHTYNYTRGVLSGGGTDIIVGRLDKPYQGTLPAAALQQALPAPQGEPASAIQFPQQGNGAPPAQPARRGRRSNAEKAAMAAAASQQAPIPAAPTPAAPAFAPFRPAAVETPAPQQGAFGIAPAVPPNAELQNTLGQLFKN